MRNAKLTIEVTVGNVPDHVTDQQVLDALRRGQAWNITWPEPRSYVTDARLVTPAVAEGTTEGSESAAS